MVFNTQELVEMSASELSKRTKAALDEFVEALKTGDQISQKGRIYQAYEDERMKRQKKAHEKYMWYAE